MAIRDKTAGRVEAARDKTAGRVEVVRDRAAGGVEAVLIMPLEAKKGPRGRRRWWNVRGERICRRSAGGLPEALWIGL